MSAPKAQKESRNAWQRPDATLDEVRWQAWAGATALRAAKWAAVVAALGIWSHLASFEVVVRFLVTAGSMGVMFEFFRARRWLLYNPAAPVFRFSGGWRRAAVAAGIVTVIPSLTWRNVRSAS